MTLVSIIKQKLLWSSTENASTMKYYTIAKSLYRTSFLYNLINQYKLEELFYKISCNKSFGMAVFIRQCDVILIDIAEVAQMCVVNKIFNVTREW